MAAKWIVRVHAQSDPEESPVSVDVPVDSLNFNDTKRFLAARLGEASLTFADSIDSPIWVEEGVMRPHFSCQ